MFSIFSGFILTLIAYLIAKPINKCLPQVPLLIIGMFLVIGFAVAVWYSL